MEDLKNQIINKAGFLIYTDYWEKYFSKMTGDQVKEVFKIIFHFNTTFEILKTNDLAVEMVVSTIIDSIKRDAIKRCKQSIASARNGKLGGRPKVNNEIKKTKPIKEKNIEESKFKPIAEKLKNVIEEKLKKKIQMRGWCEEIRKLIEIDLKERSEPEKSVITCIEAIKRYHGEDNYFPIIQSASSFREKFSKIEYFLKTKQPKQADNSLNYFTKFANNLNKGGGNE